MRLELKIAILASGKSQRDVSLWTGIPETRLSAIVRHRAAPLCRERDAIAMCLGSPAAELFPQETGGRRQAADREEIRHESREDATPERHEAFQAPTATRV
jgi:hypothetical protein